MLFIKKSGNRYYKEDRFNMRSFPISKVEAEKLITEGKAELVDRFIFDFLDVKTQAESEPQHNNILDITARLQKKQEEKQTQELINKFTSDYLPNLTKADLQTLFNTGKEDIGETLVKICMRIDLEKRL